MCMLGYTQNGGEFCMSTENEKRLLRCCFTGHRPGKLHMSELQIKHALAAAIESAYADGYRTFITGMAQGVDIWAGELVLEFKGIHPDIHIICALPHPDFEKRWSKDWQQRYNTILSKADLTKTVCDTFSYGAYQKRNEWMVNHSARVIAVYNGEAGGTRNTIEYAKKQGVSLVMIDG